MSVMTGLESAWIAVVVALSIGASAPRLHSLILKLGEGWALPDIGFVVTNTGSHAGTMVLAGSILLIAAMAGAGCWRWISPPGSCRKLRPWSVIPLGAIGCSLALLGLLLVGLWWMPVMIAACGIPAVGYLVGRSRASTPPDLPFVFPRQGDPARPWAVVALCALVIWIPWSLAPESQRDGYEYFLAGPERWLHAHGLSVTGAPATQHYPALAELLYAFPVAAGLDQAAKLLNLCVLGCGVCGFLSAVAPSLAGRWAGLFLAASSLTGGVLATTGKNEGFGAGFVLLALAAGCPAGGSIRTVVLSAVFAAGALSTKLLAVVNLVWLPCVFLLLSPRMPFRRVAAWGAVAAAVALPWWLKSLALTGDPWYPVLSASTGLFRREWDHRYAEVWRLTTGGTTFQPGCLAAAGRSLIAEHAALAALLPALLLRPSRFRVIAMAGSLTYLGWHAVFSPMQLPRWAFPTLVPVLLLVGAAAPAWLAVSRWRRPAFILVALAGWLGAVAARDGDPNPGPYLLGAESRGAFSNRFLTTFADPRERLAAEPGGGALLLTGEVRGYGLPQPVRLGSRQAAGEPPLTWEIAAGSGSPDRMAVRFRQLGITRILVNPVALMRAAELFTPFPWTSAQLDRYGEFVARWWEMTAAPRATDHVNGATYLYRVRRTPVTRPVSPVAHLPGAESEIIRVIREGGGASATLRRVEILRAGMPRVVHFDDLAGSVALAAADPGTAFRLTAGSVAHGWLNDDNAGIQAAAALELHRFDDAILALQLIRAGWPGWELWADRYLAECRLHRSLELIGLGRMVEAERLLAGAIAALPAARGPDRHWLVARAALLHAARSLALGSLGRTGESAAELRVATAGLPDLGDLHDPTALRAFIESQARAMLPSAR